MKSNLLFFVSISAAALSSSGFASDWSKCRSMTEDAERLACYDQLVDSLNTTSPTNHAAQSVNAVAPSSVNTVTEPAKAAAPAAVAVSAEMLNATSQKQTEQTFGMEQQIAETSQIDEIKTSYEGLFTGWKAKQQFTFANNQIWQISDGSSAHHHFENPTIVIERGIFGSFVMKVEGLNRSPKVKRIK